MPLRWPWQHRVVKFQWIVFGLTFYSHMAMHATRKALSNIKAELTEDEDAGVERRTAELVSRIEGVLGHSLAKYW